MMLFFSWLNFFFTHVCQWRSVKRIVLEAKFSSFSLFTSDFRLQLSMELWNSHDPKDIFHISVTFSLQLIDFSCTFSHIIHYSLVNCTWRFLYRNTRYKSAFTWFERQTPLTFGTKQTIPSKKERILHDFEYYAYKGGSNRLLLMLLLPNNVVNI